MPKKIEKKRVTYNPAAVDKYKKKAYDRLEISVRKGRKAAIKKVAEKQGESINGFVTVAIDERMERLDSSEKKADTWDKFDKIVAEIKTPLNIKDFPRVDLGHDLITFEV